MSIGGSPYAPHILLNFPVSAPRPAVLHLAAPLPAGAGAAPAVPREPAPRGAGGASVSMLHNFSSWPFLPRCTTYALSCDSMPIPPVEPRTQWFGSIFGHA